MLRALYLKQIEIAYGETVSPKQNLVRIEVLDRRSLHRRRHSRSILRPGAPDGFQIMKNRTIDSRLKHIRGRADPLLKTLVPRSGLIVQVPVKRFCDNYALCELQSKRVHIVNEGEKSCYGDRIFAYSQAEFTRLLDRGDGIASRIGKDNNIRICRLGLKQERRKIRRVERMPDRAQNRASGSLDDLGCVVFQRAPGGAVEAHEKHPLAPQLHQRFQTRRNHRVGVPRPARYCLAAKFSGHIGRDHAREGDDLAPRACDFQNGQGNRRSGAIENRIDAIDVVPLPRQVCTDVRLAGVVGHDQLNRFAKQTSAKILDGEARRGDGALSSDGGIRPGQVGEHAYLDVVIGRKCTAISDGRKDRCHPSEHLRFSQGLLPIYL